MNQIHINEVLVFIGKLFKIHFIKVLYLKFKVLQRVSGANRVSLITSFLAPRAG
jgi:hypothetical protein